MPAKDQMISICTIQKVLPLLKDGAFTLPESTLILEYLEDAYPNHINLRSKDPKEVAKMRLWMRKRRWNSCCQQNHSCIVNRHIYKKTDKEQLADYYAKMRDGVRKNNDKINIEMGLESPLLPPSIQAFKELFSEMNQHL